MIYNYICTGCNKPFDEPIKYCMSVDGDPTSIEEFSVCPYCEEQYVDAIQCCQCDETIDCDYIELANGEYVCENCYTLHKLEDLFERRSY